MTTLGELFGDKSDSIARNVISIGDVHILPMTSSDGITPKGGQMFREKFFIVLGFDADGNIIGGIVINSHINLRLPSSVTDYLMPVSVSQMPFLHHDSFINCSKLLTVSRHRFNSNTYRGHVDDDELMQQIVGTVIDNPYISKQLLHEYGII